MIYYINFKTDCLTPSISIKITNSKINLNIVKIPDNIEEKMKILIFVNIAL